MYLLKVRSCCNIRKAAEVHIESQTKKIYIKMKKFIYALLLAPGLLKCTSEHQSRSIGSDTMDYFELSPDNAHPNARKLLTEDFYWSPIEETGPFGSDDGSDCFYGFAEWRTEHQNESPVTYLNDLILTWGYPKFDLNVTEPNEVKNILNDMDSRMLIGQDNAVVAIGFGQFVLEGKIDNDIKELTRKAIRRELTTDLLNEFRSDYQETRRDQLEKMLVVIDKM
jgi:uncharacterized protein YfeS